jgi:putative endonuclease
MASESGTLYVGMTNNLLRRILEHKSGEIKGFTQKYGCNRLVYYEDGDDVWGALEREKQIKKWRRSRKELLIRSINPTWKDLTDELLD